MKKNFLYNFGFLFLGSTNIRCETTENYGWKFHERKITEFAKNS